MSEIIHYDNICKSSIQNITGITKLDNKLYISSKASLKSFASYEITPTGKIAYDPTYHDLFGSDIRYVSSFENYLVIVARESFSVFLVDPIKNTIINLMIYNELSDTSENLKEYMVNSGIFPHELNKRNLNLTACIINKSNVYFFIQNRTCKKTMLFLVKGKLRSDKIALTTEFSLLTYFNLYKVGRDAGLSKRHAKTLICTGVTLNNDTNSFIFLIVYSGKGFKGILTKLDIFEGLNSVGGYMHPITLNDKSILTLDNKPRGVTYYKDNLYYVITNMDCNKSNNFTKYFIIKVHE